MNNTHNENVKFTITYLNDDFSNFVLIPENFPDPGQQASIARFVTDKWIPISKTKDKTYNESSGFNSHKVTYGIKSCIRSWYNTHEEIDSEIIKDKAGNW